MHMYVYYIVGDAERCLALTCERLRNTDLQCTWNISNSLKNKLNAYITINYTLYDCNIQSSENFDCKIKTDSNGSKYFNSSDCTSFTKSQKNWYFPQYNPNSVCQSHSYCLFYNLSMKSNHALGVLKVKSGEIGDLWFKANQIRAFL